MNRIALLLILVLALVACGPNGAPVSTEAPADTAVPAAPTNAATETTVSGETEIEATAEATEVGSSPAIPALSPDQIGVVRPQDHFLGATNPVVTIIEYGDFQ